MVLLSFVYVQVMMGTAVAAAVAGADMITSHRMDIRTVAAVHQATCTAEVAPVAYMAVSVQSTNRPAINRIRIYKRSRPC